MYGFYDECLKKYGNIQVWKVMTDLFDYLPLTALVENSFFCLHGGISPNVKVLDHVRMVDRLHEVPHEGIMCDLLWSDPEEIEGCTLSQRGAGYVFGSNVSQEFCHTNNLKMIARAHQCVQGGYQYTHNEKVCTIFSAPNYCYRCNNEASIMEVNEHLEKNIITFDPAPRRGNKQIMANISNYFQ